MTAGRGTRLQRVLHSLFTLQGTKSYVHCIYPLATPSHTSTACHDGPHVFPSRRLCARGSLTGLRADLAGLGLNHEQNLTHSHQLAKEAYDRAPNEINCAVTYAFSEYRLGRNAEALGIIQTLSSDQLHDPHAAVYAALVLIEAGQIDAAKEYIGAAENDRIYPEEKRLLDEAKTKLIAAKGRPAPEPPVLPRPNETPPIVR